MAIETDPVCGMQVDTETSQLSFEHEGTTYWFCGRGCLLEFRPGDAEIDCSASAMGGPPDGRPEVALP